METGGEIATRAVLSYDIAQIAARRFPHLKTFGKKFCGKLPASPENCRFSTFSTEFSTTSVFRLSTAVLAAFSAGFLTFPHSVTGFDSDFHNFPTPCGKLCGNMAPSGAANSRRFRERICYVIPRWCWLVVNHAAICVSADILPAGGASRHGERGTPCGE